MKGGPRGEGPGGDVRRKQVGRAPRPCSTEGRAARLLERIRQDGIRSRTAAAVRFGQAAAASANGSRNDMPRRTDRAGGRCHDRHEMAARRGMPRLCYCRWEMRRDCRIAGRIAGLCPAVLPAAWPQPRPASGFGAAAPKTSRTFRNAQRSSAQMFCSYPPPTIDPFTLRRLLFI